MPLLVEFDEALVDGEPPCPFGGLLPWGAVWIDN
jgi:hypothetical protein